jgi:predicted alpha-1,2-mannosidase
MWDIYRATLPLHTITNPALTADFVNSLTAKAEEGGWLPIFPISCSYTSAMIGDHAISFIGDAICKDITGFDRSKAYTAMRRNAFEHPDSASYLLGKGRRALHSWLKYGFIPMEDGVADAFHRREQASRTLEYAYDDFVLAQAARSLGHEDDFQKLALRAGAWKHVMDPSSGWARGRHADGRFTEHFDPSEKMPYITEGTPRHYTWYVPHDVQGLINFMGQERFITRLDSMFSEGYYWHGNEPGHQTPFLFNWAGVPWKTQERVREVMRGEYGTGPGGLCGNEDAGQMSSWYVFASAGFYPVCPGTPQYAIASPSFPKVTFHLENGKKFMITANNASPENIYIQSATMDGKPYNKSYIEHSDIVRGASLIFEMGSTPNKSWAAAKESVPFSMSN